MIKWFKIKLLAQKGLSCGKTRKQSVDETWRDTMDCSPIMRWLLLALAAVVIFRIGSWGRLRNTSALPDGSCRHNHPDSTHCS